MSLSKKNVPQKKLLDFLKGTDVICMGSCRDLQKKLEKLKKENIVGKMYYAQVASVPKSHDEIFKNCVTTTKIEKSKATGQGLVYVVVRADVATAAKLQPTNPDSTNLDSTSTEKQNKTPDKQTQKRAREKDSDSRQKKRNKKIKQTTSTTEEELRKKITDLEDRLDKKRIQVEDNDKLIDELREAKNTLHRQLDLKRSREENLTADFRTLDMALGLLMQNYREMDLYVRGIVARPSVDNLIARHQQVLNSKVNISDSELRNVLSKNFR
jgi:hypothetical protein